MKSRTRWMLVIFGLLLFGLVIGHSELIRSPRSEAEQTREPGAEQRQPVIVGVVHLGGLFELPACGSADCTAREGAAGPGSRNHRAEATCGLLEPARLGGSFLLGRVQRAAKRLRADLRGRPALYTADDGGRRAWLCR